MNAHRLDSETVERLLDDAMDRRNGPHPLAVLLSAVRAAPGSGELAGEAAAVRAYRLARQGAPRSVSGARRSGFTLTGFGLRAAVAALLVAGTGGVALAAAGGVLPNPLRTPGPPSAPAVEATGSPGGDTEPPSVTPSSSADRPDPSTAELCRAYRIEAVDNPGRALDNPAFTGLVGAAGGRDRVPGYCDRVLATAPGGSDPHTTPTDRPGNRPSVHPTGRAAHSATPTRRPDRPGDPDPATPGADQRSRGWVPSTPWARSRP
ncbi:hypothetical protein [Micromonospora sp. NPDC126480]|uniref:hypothetical protein n=1 Tax=Micromonospora sp. NPDC126480 TaxID=3155312 RepID=UPI00331DF4C0